MTHPLISQIDLAYALARREDPFRAHLGGSIIGRKCERELYYSFHWFRRPTFKGRLLRLFDRGHKEEFSFLALLRGIGIEILPHSECLMYHPESDSYVTIPARFSNVPPTEPEIEMTCMDVSGDPHHVARAKAQGVTIKQWRISAINNHFGGSLDGIGQADFAIEIWEHFEGRMAELTGRVIPPHTPFLTEFKTHNTKSFALLASGVRVAKPEHYVQMQTYMSAKGLRFGLYFAVNKDNDELHLEVVELDPEVGQASLVRADRIINADRVPDRIGKHPSWHDCKFCEFAQICHYGDTKEIDRNCRTCTHSRPVEDGRWQCRKWNALIPVDAVLKGCDSHNLIRD